MTKTYTKTDSNGTVSYYSDADCLLLHRSDGPAYEGTSGGREWYLNGLHHRADGPAYEGANGTRMWFLSGQYHRHDGPAVEWADGYRAWYLNGNLHRSDGPAVEYAGGDRSWYLTGDNLAFSTWLARTPVTDAERLVLALKYSEYA